MMELLGPLWIALLPIIGVALLVGILNVWLWLGRRRGRRSPLTQAMLRSPGHSIRVHLDDLHSDIISSIAVAMMLPVSAYAIYATSACASSRAWSTAVVISFCAAILGLLGWYARRFLRLIRERRKQLLAYEGELSVGQELTELLRDGFSVFHDIDAGAFNVDHVVVGPTGVFAVETKARSKPPRGGGGEAVEVIYDGRALRFPSWVEVAPLDQARRQARWLARWLSSAVGAPVEATPVIAIPGWFVKRTARNDVFVYNGIKPQGLFTKLKGEQLSLEMQQRIRHQLEARVRDVAPRSYSANESDRAGFDGRKQ